MSETLAKKLETFQSKRRFPNWKPRKANGVYYATGKPEEKVVFNCLHFISLEIQVKDWVSAQDNIDEDTRKHLLRNSEDEEKHDVALSDLLEYVGQPKSTPESESLVNRWQSLTCSPIVAAYTLEMGVFFSILPALTKYGDVYATQVSTWINDDERIHVETNLAVMKALGLKLTRELCQLVFDTVYYIFSPLGEETANAQAKRALKRLTTGKDEQMLAESLPPTIAFFEQRDKRSIVY